MSRAKTYRDLRNQLGNIPEEHLDDTITIYDRSDDEYYSVVIDVEVPETDVLDPNHPVLVTTYL